MGILTILGQRRGSFTKSLYLPVDFEVSVALKEILCLFLGIVAIINSCIIYILIPSDARGFWNRSPLHIICSFADEWSNNLDIVKYLVEKAHCDIGEYYTTY